MMKILILSSFVTTVVALIGGTTSPPTGQTSPPTSQCTARVDVAFLVDGSGSIENYFQDEKNFVKELARSFGISDAGTRAGVILYSTGATIRIRLNDNDNQQDFENAVDAISFPNGFTDTAAALQLAQNGFFTTANGARSGVPKVVIVMTDGASNSRSATVAAANSLRATGAHVIAIGIGSGAQPDEIRAIAGIDSNAFIATTFAMLQDPDFLRSVQEMSCQVADPCSPNPCKNRGLCKPHEGSFKCKCIPGYTGTTCTESTSSSQCNGIADVAFIVDRSGSVFDYDQKIKDFVNDLANSFGIGLDGTRLGVVTFNSTALINIRLDQFNDFNSFQAAVNSLPAPIGGTFIDRGLRLAQSNLFTPAYGSRPNVPRVVIVMTDGFSFGDPDVAAAELRAAGIQTIAIGITRNVNRNQVRAIAGSDSNAFFASSFDVLSDPDFLRSIQEMGCQLADPCYPNPCENNGICKRQDTNFTCKCLPGSQGRTCATKVGVIHKAPHVTGTTPPAIDCPNSLCTGKHDGNFEISGHPNYFVQCVSGLAYCQACWPLHLVFSQQCNQCLYNKHDRCVTTKKWHPATTFHCPDKCPHYGPHFSGNVEDEHNPRQYIACWHGATVGCIACPEDLEFNQDWNACLYKGQFKTKPLHL